MSYRTNMIYCYDGTFKGFLCCIFESYSKKEMPIDILPDDRYEASLYEVKFIKSNDDIFKRVYSAIKNQFDGGISYLINTAFLNGDCGKEKVLFDFIRLCFEYGNRILNNYKIPIYSKVYNLVRAVEMEAHHLLGFIRFQEYEKHLISVVNPKHYVLPVIRKHFCNRFANERFLIYDNTHKTALIYMPYKSTIIPIEAIELPKESESEDSFCRLWALYYDTIAIKERKNDKCRINHMPKRFWQDLTEMQYADKITALKEKNTTLIE